jgi:hypothetical protein
MAHGGAFPDELLERFKPSANSPAHLQFGYLFPELQAPEHLLSDNPKTAAALANLGATMVATSDDEMLDSSIPAAYTYFGQFVAHDISAFDLKGRLHQDKPSCDFRNGVNPNNFTKLANTTVNNRGSQIQLDSIYNKAPLEDDKIHLKLGAVTKPDSDSDSNSSSVHLKEIWMTDPFQDVFRDLDNQTPVIGDPRNDNNVIVSQLHVAFVRAHNVLVDLLLNKGVDRTVVFQQARTLLRQHYHHLLIYDFLHRVSDEKTLQDVLAREDHLYDPKVPDQQLPLEFTVGAYRFGHSMVTSTYYYNENLPGVSFSSLVPLRMMKNPGTDKRQSSLAAAHVIEWKRFVADRNGAIKTVNLNPNFAGLLIPALIRQQFTVLNEKGEKLPCESNLAVIDLLRGYMLRLPTGQAVARCLIQKGRDLRALTADEIISTAKKRSSEQLNILTAPEFDFCNRTPLWFYVLAEAEVFNQGKRLGPIGTTIVAEVLLGLVRRSPDSILSEAGPYVEQFKPLETPTGTFRLEDLLRLAKVFNDQPREEITT